MKCRVCRQPAVIDVRRHNANFCATHFLKLCRDQVAKVIDEFAMIETGDRVLVAVSGGKDSLAVWDILRLLGFDAEGLYIGLASVVTATGRARRYGPLPPNAAGPCR